MSRFKSSSSAGIFPSVASKSSLKIASSSGMVVLCIDFMVQFQIFLVDVVVLIVS